MFYPDIWEAISNFLDSDDLYSISLTCKSAYKAFKRKKIQEKISWPLKCPKRLTADQREIVRQMEEHPIRVKLIHGSVGSGKTIVSLAYVLRKIEDQKLIIVLPPNLIKMWKDTCEQFFEITPRIVHNSNPKYNPSEEMMRTEPPEEKIIIYSYILFSRMNGTWLLNKKHYLIIDEAHHRVHHQYDFQEIVALSATPFKNEHLTYGIKKLFEDYEVSVDNVSFSLERNVIAAKLPEVIHMEPLQWKLRESVQKYIMDKKWKYLRNANAEIVNTMRDMKWIPEALTHTFVKDLKELYCGSYITIGRKKISLPTSGEQFVHKTRDDLVKIFPYPWETEVSKIYHATLKKEAEKNLERIINSCVKYHQCLAILEMLRERKEKAVIFDININYLPFLHKFLLDHGINSYMFTTHYDVNSRQRQLEKFKSDPEANVLLSSVQMLGEGHNVTEANHVIFLTNMLDKNKYYQAIGRCWRYPQKKPVYIHYMFNSELDRKIKEHADQTYDIENADWELLLSL